MFSSSHLRRHSAINTYYLHSIHNIIIPAYIQLTFFSNVCHDPVFFFHNRHQMEKVHQNNNNTNNGNNNNIRMVKKNTRFPRNYFPLRLIVVTFSIVNSLLDSVVVVFFFFLPIFISFCFLLFIEFICRFIHHFYIAIISSAIIFIKLSVIMKSESARTRKKTLITSNIMMGILFSNKLVIDIR